MEADEDADARRGGVAGGEDERASSASSLNAPPPPGKTSVDDGGDAWLKLGISRCSVVSIPSQRTPSFTVWVVVYFEF